MNVMQRYTWETLRRNRKRTVVTIVGVVISAAMITAVAVFMASLISMVQRATIADTGNWHVRLSGVPVKNLSVLEQNKLVGDMVVSRDAGYALLEGSQNPSKPYLFVRQYGPGGFGRMSVRLVEGRLPQNAGEIALSESLEKNAGIAWKVGDKLTLGLGQRLDAEGQPLEPASSIQYRTDEETGQWVIDPATGKQVLSESFVPQTTATYTVVGIMERPGFEPSWAAACGAVGYLDVTALPAGSAVDVYYTAPHVSRQVYDDGKTLVKEADATGEVTYNSELLRYTGVVKEDNVYNFFMGFMAVIIVIIVTASVAMIYNAFAISVSERSRQLGLLASAGATRQQKRASVYFEGLLIGLVGIPLGILAGVGGIAVTLAAIQPLMDSFLHVAAGVTLDLVVKPSAIALAVALSAVTIFISAVKPARMASRIMPIDAIRQAESVRITGKTVRTSAFTRRLFGFEAEIALKNLKRSRKKYRATIVSLVISIVLFLTVSTYVSMTGTLAGATSDGVNYDIGIVYNSLDDARREAIDDRIADLGLTSAITRTASVDGGLSLSGGQLTGPAKQFNAPQEDGQYLLGAQILRLDDASFAEYAQAVGVSTADYGAAQSPRAILINAAQSWYFPPKGSAQKVTGSVMNVGVGDALAFLPGSDPAQQKVALTVGAVTDVRPMGTLTQGFSSVTLVVSGQAFVALASGLGTNGEWLMSHHTYMTTGDDQLLERQLLELTQGLPSSGYYIHNVQSAARSERNLMTFMGVFIYGFIVLICMICIANIFNTVSTNIALRRKEFAMLRSVGMTPAGFGRMMRFESIFYGLKGLLYGLPISAGIAVGLYFLQGSVLSTGFTLPLASYGFAVLMIFVIVSVTILYSTRRVRRENIIDALREENI